ncbi:MAG: phytase [Planctomycetota bacterium]
MTGGMWLAAALGVATVGEVQRPAISVEADAETTPVQHLGDAADDAAIWNHPSDPRLSLLIATDKQGGLVVYDTDGQIIQSLPDGRMNNVDLRTGFPLADGRTIDIVVASNRDHDSIAVYAVAPDGRSLIDVAAGRLGTDLDGVYGICLYRSHETGGFYCFVNSKAGEVQQWRLESTSQSRVDASKVRSFQVGSQTEGMVADDATGVLYVGEEDNAIWRYKAEPDANSKRSLVAVVQPNGPLVGDIEGLALYVAEGGDGYLIASSQGDSTFAVFERTLPNRYLFSFEVVGSDSIDRVTGTDGLEITNLPFGYFDKGVIVVQDNENGGEPQNFKIIRWDALAQRAREAGQEPLLIDTHHRPSSMELE